MPDTATRTTQTDYLEGLLGAGEHCASLLLRCKSSSDDRPTDDRINAVVNTWRNRFREDPPPDERDALIEKMANAIGSCSEMLNGRDQMLDMIERPEGPSQKSPLTAMVDDALEGWRTWRFQ